MYQKSDVAVHDALYQLETELLISGEDTSYQEDGCYANANITDEDDDFFYITACFGDSNSDFEQEFKMCRYTLEVKEPVSGVIRL